MDRDTCLLITVLCEDDHSAEGGSLLRCALKLDEPMAEDYLEAEGRARLRQLLPCDVSSIGPIVNVEPLFEVTDLTGNRLTGSRS